MVVVPPKSRPHPFTFDLHTALSLPHPNGVMETGLPTLVKESSDSQCLNWPTKAIYCTGDQPGFRDLKWLLIFRLTLWLSRTRVGHRSCDEAWFYTRPFRGENFWGEFSLLLVTVFWVGTARSTNHLKNGRQKFLVTSRVEMLTDQYRLTQWLRQTGL